MGHRHLYSVLPRRPALRPLLDFHPFRGWSRSRIHNRTVVCFTLHFTHWFPYPDPAFDPRFTSGRAYSDVLHVYGMSRAGYIPQMFNLGLPNPVVVFELLQKTGARALVCEPSFPVDLSGCPVPNYSAVQVCGQDVADVALPPPQIDCSGSDLVFIFHTSGSTGGSPKLVPCNRRWLDSIVAKSKQLAQVRSTRGQDVTVAMCGNLQNCLALFVDLTFSILSIHRASMCHLAQPLSK